MPDNIDFLALIAELHKALDRQSDRFDRAISNLSLAVVDKLDRVDQRLEKMDQRFEKMDQRFEKMDQRFEKMDQRFERMDQRFEHIEGELTQLNGRMGQVEYHLSEIDKTAKSSLLESQMIVLKINSLDEAVGRIEKFQQAQEDVLRRLGILEGVVLTPARGGKRSPSAQAA